jgi:hypothetical protein
LLLLAVQLAHGGTLRFPAHPRVEYTAQELVAWKADPARSAEIRQLILRADGLLAHPLVVPDKEGQWIFYYACPKDGARLTPESLERHVCPLCKTVYTDARTVAAYRTLLQDRLNDDCHTLAVAYALRGEDKYAQAVRTALQLIVITIVGGA